MRIVGIIPARLQSTRLPRKLLLDETGAQLNEMTLENTGIGRDLGIIIVAIKRLDGTMGFNPNSTSIVNVGDTLVALGETSKLKELEQLAAVS